MKKCLLLGAILTISTAATADVGVGVSLQSGSSEIYIPYDISESLRIEPSIFYDKTKNDDSYSSDTYELGLGLFKTKQVVEKLNLLLGARIGYQDSTEKFSTYSKSSVNGYFISPTLGFEYFVIDKFSIGAEVALKYHKLKLEDDDPYAYSEDLSITSTDTSISARFYF